MNDSQIGKFFRALLEYQVAGKIDVDTNIRIAFEFIKNQLNINADKWKEEKNKRSEADRRGMTKRWNKDNKENE